MAYAGLSFKNDRYSWDSKEMMTEEYLAGVITGLKTLNTNGAITIRRYVGDNIIFDLPMIPDFLSHYLLIPNLDEKQLIVQNIPPDLYAWGILNNNKYDLYGFESAEFIAGFIYVCETFDVDFRDYTESGPFKTIDGFNTFFNIEGYDLDPIVVPSQNFNVGPYYTGSYQTYDDYYSYPIDYS